MNLFDMAELDQGTFESSYEGSPSKIEKRDNLRLAYDCSIHKSNSYKNPKEMWAFACKVEDVMFRLLRFIPSEVKQELQDHYKELQSKLEENKRIEQPAEVRENKEVELMFEYAKPVHEHNMKLLPMANVVQRNVEGELDISKEEIIEVIRGGKREDDGTIQYRS
jgi:hypothetical protein